MILFSGKFSGRPLFLLISVLLVTLWSGCTGGSGNETDSVDFSVEGVEGSDIVVAEVNGLPITAAYLVNKIRIQYPKMPQEGPGLGEQCEQVLKAVIEERCFNIYGEYLGLDKDPEFLKTLSLSRSYMLSSMTNKRTVKKRATPSEEAQREYYDAQKNKFQIKPQTWYRQIQVDSEARAWGLHKQIQAGADFETLAKEHSVDEITAPKGGRMPPMNTSFMCGHFGKQKALGELVMKMEKDELSDPFQSDRGWHLIQIEAVRNFRKLPFEEVQESIITKMRSSVEMNVLRTILDSLKADYNVTIDTEALDRFYFLQMSDTDMFDAAQRTSDSVEKRKLYNQILIRFPDSEHAAESLFMVAFISIEDLGDTLRARECFDKFLTDYPNHDMVGSARLMYGEITE